MRAGSSRAWLSRNDTVLRVATKIVEMQREFLEHGEEAMKSMVLRDMAEALELHESTVSRVTTQKYMHTPRGTFEFKYFFSSHVNTAAGGECSSAAIRALIRKLVAAEPPSKPLSDQRIADDSWGPGHQRGAPHSREIPRGHWASHPRTSAAG